MILHWKEQQEPLFYCSTLEPQRMISVAHWLADVAAAVSFLNTQQGQNALLYNDNFYSFSVWFIALAMVEKSVFLPPNSQPETLAQIKQHVHFECPQTVPHREQVQADHEVRLSAETTVVFFTSGSTGQPKLVEKKLKQLWLEAQQLESVFGAGRVKPTMFAATVPVNHIYGLLFRLLWPLCSGQPMLVPTIEYNEELFHLDPQQPCCLISSPSHITRFTALERLAAHRLDIFSSGAPLPAITAKRLQNGLGQAPIEIFGSTETGGIAWRKNPCGQASWQLFPGIRTQLGPEQRLMIQSPYLTGEGWWQTEDRVEFVADSQFILKGRADRIVKVSEKRVSLPEMERWCEQCPWLGEARLILLADKRPTLALVAVLNSAGNALLADKGKLAVNNIIREYLLQRFDRVVLPRKFRYVVSLPYDARGKLTERKLTELFNG